MKPATKILFIVNPAAGGYHANFDKIVKEFFSNQNFEIKLEVTKKKGDANNLASEGVKSGFNTIVAAGGDGTVNEIGSSLINTGTALGIIPMGSGNGLARHHKIPMDFKKALEVISKNNRVQHDVLHINKFVSFNVSGIGFDAHVAHLFGKNGKRGFSSYAKLVMSEFKQYQNFECKITSANQTNSCKAMMVSIANSSQFGNNAFIAPDANTNDGIANLTIVKKMSFWKLPSFALSIFNKSISSSPFAQLLAGESFIIECNEEMPLHIDGEAAGFGKLFSVHTAKSAISLIVP